MTATLTLTLPDGQTTSASLPELPTELLDAQTAQLNAYYGRSLTLSEVAVLLLEQALLLGLLTRHLDPPPSRP